MNKNKTGFSKETLKLPDARSRARELRAFEDHNAKALAANRWELQKVIKTLSDLNERIPDTKVQLRILQGMLPTAKAVQGNAIPDSMLVEVQNLLKITDQVEQNIPDQAVTATITQIRTILNQVLSTIPSE